MTDYKASKRIIGTSAQRATFAISAPQWQELDRVTLSSAGNDLDTSTFSTKDNIMILANPIWNSGNPSPDFRFNGDSGSNYSRRLSVDGGSDIATTSQAELYSDTWGGGAASGMHSFEVMELVNMSAQEKLIIYDKIYNRAGTGAGNTPNRIEGVHKWANTSAQINRVQLLSSVSNAFASGTEIVVLGYDNDEDGSGSNFWQELASVTASGSSSTLSSGTFTAKKYLMVTGYIDNTDSNYMRFNSDSGSNYARRRSDNGNSDVATETSQDRIYSNWTTAAQGFIMYIINKSDEEKLVMLHDTEVDTTGAGTAPYRFELAAKWANTSDQITSIAFNKGSNYGSTSFVRVYGAD